MRETERGPEEVGKTTGQIGCKMADFDVGLAGRHWRDGDGEAGGASFSPIALVRLG